MVHLHYGLLAEILAELARSLAARDPLDEHRMELSEAANTLPLRSSRQKRAEGDFTQSSESRFPGLT
jgi:hypothetical protein